MSENKYVDLSKIPMRGKLIDWKNSIGCKCSFVYNNIVGEVEIVGYTYKKVTIKYQNKTDTISTDSLISCSIGNLLGVRTGEFKIKIGTNFKDRKRDITIIDREYRTDKNGRSRKWYKYYCNVCNWNEGWNTENHILNGIGCSSCHGNIVVTGIKDIGTTNPEMLPYFVDINDAYTHTHSSSDIVNLKCPICGTTKLISLSQFNTYGLACSACSDGVSYGEKFMYSLLRQLNVNFTTQYSKKHVSWCEGYKYDFYLYGYNAIIEVQGGQHTDNGRQRGNFKSIEEEQENDRLKKELAIENNISNYIEIDCNRSKLIIIKDSIMTSILPTLLNFKENAINWQECEKYTFTSKVKEVCDYKNAHVDMSSTEISKMLGMNRGTVRIYLQRGADNGFCIYDKELEMFKGRQKASKNRELNKHSPKIDGDFLLPKIS